MGGPRFERAEAMRVVGQALHPLQDIFAHGNLSQHVVGPAALKTVDNTKVVSSRARNAQAYTRKILSAVNQWAK